MFKDVILPVPKSILDIPGLHKRVVLPINYQEDYSVNIEVVCPFSPEKKNYKSSPIPETRAVKVVGEKYDAKGTARTIFSCIYCDHPFSVDQEAVDSIKEYNKNTKEKRISELLSKIKPNLHA